MGWPSLLCTCIINAVGKTNRPTKGLVSPDRSVEAALLNSAGSFSFVPGRIVTAFEARFATVDDNLPVFVEWYQFQTRTEGPMYKCNKRLWER